MADDLVVDLECDQCGWVATPERWRADGAIDTSSTETGVRVTTVAGTPEWAAEFAAQGSTQVTRYRCPECGERI